MRKKAVYEQLGGLDKVTPETEEIFKSLTVQQKLSNRRHWHATSGYSRRVAAEGGFSTTKRIFGDGVCSRKPENVEREIRLMYAIYNNMIDRAESKGHVGVRVRLQCCRDEGKGGRKRTAGKRRAAARAGQPAGAAAAAGIRSQEPAGDGAAAGGGASNDGGREGLVGAKIEYG